MGIRWEGIKKLLLKLVPSTVDEASLAGLEEMGRVASNNIHYHAPFLTGRTRSSVLKGGQGNVWIIRQNPPSLTIGTNITHKGKSYPRILDESPLYHYRRGPFQGQQTQHWFSGVKSRLASGNNWRSASLAVAKEIHKKWEK